MSGVRPEAALGPGGQWGRTQAHQGAEGASSLGGNERGRERQPLFRRSPKANEAISDGNKVLMSAAASSAEQETR